MCGRRASVGVSGRRRGVGAAEMLIAWCMGRQPCVVASLALCLLLASAPLRAVAAAPVAVTVTEFSPRGTFHDVRQATARFSADVVTLGDPRQLDPFIVDCPATGHGRWLDTRTWVYDFSADLPAGLRCRFTLKPALHAASGAPVGAPEAFEFDTGGPRVRASYPRDGADDIDVDQAFLLALDGPVDAASIAAHASCAIANVGERIPIEVIEGEARAQLLAQRRQLGYQYFQILWKAGSESIEKVATADLARAESELVALRCRRSLPPDSEVRLLWGPGIAASSGLATADGQVLTWRTRPPFNVRVECERTNARAHCLPLQPVRVAFSAPVTVAQAARVRLRDAHGALRTATPFAPGVETVDEIAFPGPFEARGTLTVEVPADLEDDARRRPDNAARFPLPLELDDYPPLVKFNGTFGIVEARADAVLPVTLRRFENVPVAPVPGRRLRIDAPGEIPQWLRRVDAAMAPAGEWRENAGHKSVWVENTGAKSVFDTAAVTEDFTVPVTDGAQPLQVVGIPFARPGFYVVELASKALGAELLGREQPRYVATTVLVTNLAVHFKWGRESSLVWVTRLDDAMPVAGAAIEIVDYCGGRLRWHGTTGADGTARIDETLGPPQGAGYGECETWAPPQLVVSARSGEDLGFTRSNWNQGIEPAAFGLASGDASGAMIAHSVLDRSLLRAGDTLSMKHFLRQHTQTGLAVPPPRARRLAILHAGSGDRTSLPLAFDANGTATSSWDVPPEAKLGDYELVIESDDDSTPRFTQTSAHFRVEQFRTPTMRAVVQGPAAAQVRPREVALDLFLGHLNGGAAGGAPVALRVLREPRQVSFKAWPEFTFGGTAVREGPAREDEDDGGDPFAWYLQQFGAYRGPLPAGAQAASEQRITLDAQGAARVTVPGYTDGAPAQNLVAELEYQDAAGERRATSTRVPLWPAALVLGLKVEGWAGARDTLRFQVVALDPEGRAQAGRRIDVALFQRQRSSYRKRLVGGFYAFENHVDVKRIAARCSGTSDAQGVLACDVAPGVSGELLLEARAEDAAGNVALASTSAWIAGDEDWWFKPGNADRMDLLPEQREYAAGSTARLQVRMPFRHARALVTVEREGVLRSFVTELDGHAPIVDVPLEDVDAPNVYVSVLAVRGRVSWLQAAFGSLTRYLGLPWTVDGALPTAQVDLGKPAWRLGATRLNVGWQPHRLEVEVKPERTTYKVRERAAVDVTVRRADGQPLPAGSEVAFAAVDEALLELKGNESWDLLARMMGTRGLEVYTSTAQMQVIGKRHYGRKAVPHGGGGGRGPARERFDTLLAWEPRVPLDAQGHARIELPLNDALTAFRIVAVAHGGSDRFGTGAASIRTTQDVMIHAGLPPMVRTGDRFDAVFTVRNASDRTLAIEAGGVVVARDARAGSNTPVPLAARTLELAPGAAREIAWPITAPADGSALEWDVAVRAGDGSAADRLTVRTPLAPAVPLTTQQATLAQLDAPLALPAALPSGASPLRGGLRVALRAHLGDGLDGVRGYMSEYVYDCFEQRVSRAIVAGDERAWRVLMSRLGSYLDRDGLLRYFATDALAGSDTLTSYVLAVAAQAGWAVPEDVRPRMIAGLTGFVKGKVVRDSVLPTTDLLLRRLAAIAALARQGAADRSLLEGLAIAPAEWPTSAVLDWLDILRYLPEVADADAARASALAVLRARLTLGGTTLAFSTEHTDALWWLMISGDVNAVRLLLMAVDEPAWRDDVPRLVRGTLGRQAHGHWNTTTANAWGTLALARFSAVFEAAPVRGTTTVSLGAASETVSWPEDAQQPAAVELPWPLAPATLSLRHQGGGRPWAMVAARAAVPRTEPTIAGYAIAREVTAVAQRSPGHWTRGDVARVRLTVNAQSDMGWVVVDDPVPAGATVLGHGLGGDAASYSQGEQRAGWVQPAYEERRFDAFRAYYSFVPKGEWTVEYTVRLNTAGTFALPATRVEAMYAPETFGELPNAPLEVTSE